MSSKLYFLLVEFENRIIIFEIDEMNNLKENFIYAK